MLSGSTMEMAMAFFFIFLSAANFFLSSGGERMSLFVRKSDFRFFEQSLVVCTKLFADGLIILGGILRFRGNEMEQNARALDVA